MLSDFQRTKPHTVQLLDSAESGGELSRLSMLLHLLTLRVWRRSLDAAWQRLKTMSAEPSEVGGVKFANSSRAFTMGKWWTATIQQLLAVQCVATRDGKV